MFLLSTQPLPGSLLAPVLTGGWLTPRRHRVRRKAPTHPTRRCRCGGGEPSPDAEEAWRGAHACRAGRFRVGGFAVAACGVTLGAVCIGVRMPRRRRAGRPTPGRCARVQSARPCCLRGSASCSRTWALTRRTRRRPYRWDQLKMFWRSALKLEPLPQGPIPLGSHCQCGGARTFWPVTTV